MSEDRIQIVGPHVIVVEGDDEERLLGALCSHMGITSVQVLPIGGKTRLRKSLQLLKLTPGVESMKTLCVVRDADDDPRAAFQSVRDALQSAGYPAPARPLQFEGRDPRVIVMIMPNSETCGAFEPLKRLIKEIARET